MTDISEYKQIIEEAKELISQLDNRINTLTCLVAMANSTSVDSIKSTLSKEVKVNEELSKIICSIQYRIDNNLDKWRFEFQEQFFIGYTFKPDYYMNKVIEEFNAKNGYKAYFITYDDFSSGNKIVIHVEERMKKKKIIRY